MMENYVVNATQFVFLSVSN